MYRYSESLTINSELFADLRSQFNTYLSHLLQEANVSGKEGELSLKIKVTTATEREHKNGAFVKEWTEPRFNWQITKKVKENKIDIKSCSGEGFMLEFDEDGKPMIKETPNKQISMFDTPFARAVDVMEAENKRKAAADVINKIVEGDEVQDAAALGLEVPEVEIEDTTGDLMEQDDLADDFHQEMMDQDEELEGEETDG